MTTLAIIGSREFNDYELLKKHIDTFVSDSKITITKIVSGGAIGADKLGEEYAKENEIPIQIFYPNWNKYGKRAGILRNYDIIKSCDIVIAFWNGISKGTKHSIDISKKMGKKCIIINYK